MHNYGWSALRWSIARRSNFRWRTKRGKPWANNLSQVVHLLLEGLRN